MQARSFFKTVTGDRSNLIERLLNLLQDNGIRFCVVGGIAASAYVEPLVSLDFDLVVANYQLGRFESLLASTFLVKRSARQIEITAPDSRVRVNVWTEARYADLIERAERRNVLDWSLPVAALDDVLRFTVWSAQEPTRSPWRRQRDLVDLARLLENYPKLRAAVPPELLARLISNGA
jgi:hypothetical protein